MIDREEQMGRRHMWERNGSDRRYQGSHQFDEPERGDRDRWRRGGGYDEDRFDMWSGDRGGRREPFIDERRQWEQGFGSRRGNYGMENQDWEDMEFSGHSRGMERGQYGGSMRQDMGGYGGRRGNMGGYGIGGGEPGGGFYGGQSRSSQYGQGSWEGSHRQMGGRGVGPGMHSGGQMEHQQQDFRGRGPKGYQRSSQRVREELCDMLMDHPHVDPSQVSIDVDDSGVVELKGSVDSRHTKRLIEDCADHIRGVNDVQNMLTVDNDFWSSSDTNMGSTKSRRNKD